MKVDKSPKGLVTALLEGVDGYYNALRIFGKTGLETGDGLIDVSSASYYLDSLYKLNFRGKPAKDILANKLNESILAPGYIMGEIIRKNFGWKWVKNEVEGEHWMGLIHESAAGIILPVLNFCVKHLTHKNIDQTLDILRDVYELAGKHTPEHIRWYGAEIGIRQSTFAQVRAILEQQGLKFLARKQAGQGERHVIAWRNDLEVIHFQGDETMIVLGCERVLQFEKIKDLVALFPKDTAIISLSGPQYDWA